MLESSCGTHMGIWGLEGIAGLLHIGRHGGAGGGILPVHQLVPRQDGREGDDRGRRGGLDRTGGSRGFFSSMKLNEFYVACKARVQSLILNP